MQAIFDQGPPPPCPAAFNLAAYVLGRAEETGDKTALVVMRPDGAEQWRYAQLEAAVRGTATGFLSAGLRPGDRLLMRVGNSVEFPICYLAALAADIIPVPTSSLLTSPEVTQIAADISPRLIVAEDGLALPLEPPCPVLSAEAMRNMYDLPPASYAMGDSDRPAYIIYTSGTSGEPRAVTHAHRTIWARRMMWEGWYGLTEHDRLLHAGAFNWTYTLGTGLLDPWTRGATALIPGPDAAPEMLGALMAQYEATLFAAAPGIYRQLLRSTPPTLPCLRHGLSAGEKLPDATRAAWECATGTPVYEAFGMSECSTFISGSPTRPAPPGTLGYPQQGRRVAVLADDAPSNGDAPVAFDTPGVLSVSRRDPGLMLGYWGADDETRRRFQGEWFLTGDLVSMAEDGALTYLGRADDMMNAGGIRVSPIEVETALNAHPAVVECAAAEVTVKADTTVIAVFYVAKDPVETDDLEHFVAGRLARYKCPRLYTRVEALPRGPNGKLLRRHLRDSYEKTVDA
ncbi:MAG TPA: class I adenylate-forming enzyme family protein [Methyloceanibacter sp.]|nr:class I adenylate-forming enzyme family protein [Methyloceanibacter sp.]